MGHLGLTWTDMGTLAHADNASNHMGRGGNILPPTKIPLLLSPQKSTVTVVLRLFFVFSAQGAPREGSLQ